MVREGVARGLALRLRKEDSISLFVPPQIHHLTQVAINRRSSAASHAPSSPPPQRSSRIAWCTCHAAVPRGVPRVGTDP